MKVSRIAKTTLFTLFWANFLNFFDRQVLAVLAPILKDYWQLSDAQVGLLATAFEITYALAPVPIALLADRWLRRRVVALALVAWSAAMALTGAAWSYAMLLVGRAGLALGSAGYGPSALAWLSDLFPPGYRSRAVGVHDLALMLGSAAGYALGGVLGVALGWRSTFLLAAIPGLVLAAVVWFLPEPARGQSDYQAMGIEPQADGGSGETPPQEAQSGPEDSTVSSGAAIRELLRIPTLIVTYAVAILINLATAGVIYWLPSLAVRSYGLDVDQAGLLIGALTVITGGAGVLAGGYAADRLLRRTPAARLLIISGSYALGFPLALAAVFVQNIAIFLALATGAVFLFTFYFPCVAPLVHQVTRPELRATAMALYLLVAHLLGSALAPTLIGWLSDQTGDLRMGIALALVLALLGALVGFWGTRFVGGDTRAMQARLEATRDHPSAD